MHLDNPKEFYRPRVVLADLVKHFAEDRHTHEVAHLKLGHGAQGLCPCEQFGFWIVNVLVETASHRLLVVCGHVVGFHAVRSANGAVDVVRHLLEHVHEPPRLPSVGQAVETSRDRADLSSCPSRLCSAMKTWAGVVWTSYRLAYMVPLQGELHARELSPTQHLQGA